MKHDEMYNPNEQQKGYLRMAGPAAAEGRKGTNSKSRENIM